MTKYWQIDSILPAHRKYRNNNRIIDVRGMEKYGLERVVAIIRDKFLSHPKCLGVIVTKECRDLYEYYRYRSYVKKQNT